MKTLVYLIRHCESEGNACRRSQAQFDGIVTRKGLLQSEAVAQRFADIPIDAIYSSDSYRARVTAEPLARLKGLPVRYRMLLREYTIGCWEGLSIGQTARQFPDIWKRWRATPYDHNVPGADQFATVAQRGMEIIRRMAAENPGGTVAAVTHSCTLNCTMTQVLKQPISEYPNMKRGDNTAVTLLEVDENGEVSARYISDISHLTPELCRSNYTGRNAATNFAFDYAKFPADRDRFLRWYRAYCQEFEKEYRPEAALELAAGCLAQNPHGVMFPLLVEQDHGLVMVDDGHGLPADCGHLTFFYVEPELRAKGYTEQAFGEAIDVLRRVGKRYLVMEDTDDPSVRILNDRFCFEPMPEHPGLLRLRLTVPGIEGPVY